MRAEPRDMHLRCGNLVRIGGEHRHALVPVALGERKQGRTRGGHVFGGRSTGLALIQHHQRFLQGIIRT